MTGDFKDNAVFFIEVDKIKPNPYQPRREFDEAKLNDLASSIKMYGVLQPLTVTRREFEKEDGGIAVEYELIAGERRLRASKLAGLREVPVLIRSQEDDDRVKLELSIIENLQREDLNPVDRARSFQQLAEQFNLKHAEIAKKVGKSREYVSNTIRLLALPEEILEALTQRKISEGHTRPLLMLSDRLEEQNVLFREITLKKMTVRDAEKIARKIAYDKVRKKERMFNSEIVELEQQASDNLGTRVHIEPKDVGGRIQIDYFNDEDLKNILEVLNNKKDKKTETGDSNRFILESSEIPDQVRDDNIGVRDDNIGVQDDNIGVPDYTNNPEKNEEENLSSEALAKEEKDDKIFTLNNFSI
jgi:ParB family transcriptional regulator, chromosome partitioning protein